MTRPASDSVRVGTRGSDLALTQAQHVIDLLRAQGVEVEREIIRTAGDQSDAPSFAEIGPQGVFVREIEQALLDGRIDVAVHSFKDLPSRSPDGLVIGAVPTREDAADVLLIRNAWLATDDRLMPIRHGARVGTSSARRRSWIKHFRHDLHVEPLRGNVPTRLGRLRDGQYDAIVLAGAGLARLRAAENLLDPLLADVTMYRLDPRRFVPAPSQGAIAVQCRRSDGALLAVLAALEDTSSRLTVEVERAALAHAEGGCDIAFGAHCTVDGAEYTLTTMLERSGQVNTATVTAPDRSALGARGWAALEREFSQ
jgi:hydroxymethylbilane synthase